MSEYELPDPKTHPVSCLVISYKVTKGIDYDDRSWDKIHFARWAKYAKELLEICGDLRSADACLVEIAEKFTTANLTWSLKTVVDHAHDWKQKKRGGVNASSSRTRLFAAMREQRASREAKEGLSKATNGTLPDAVRGILDLANAAKRENGNGA